MIDRSKSRAGELIARLEETDAACRRRGNVGISRFSENVDARRRAAEFLAENAGRRSRWNGLRMPDREEIAADPDKLYRWRDAFRGVDLRRELEAYAGSNGVENGKKRHR